MIGSLPASGDLSALVQKKCFEKHLIMEKGGRYGSVMRVLCALNVSYKEIDEMLEIFSSVVKEVNNGV
jgi:diaminobutyrate-2-oxoglutarate transaminase